MHALVGVVADKCQVSLRDTVGFAIYPPVLAGYVQSSLRDHGIRPADAASALL